MTTTAIPSALEQFHWEQQPAAEAHVKKLVDEFISRTPGAAVLAGKMKSETGTRFHDWIDTLAYPGDPAAAEAVGFEKDEHGTYFHPGALFPRLIISQNPTTVLTLKVDSVADYLAANGLSLSVEGAPLGDYRRAKVAAGQQTELHVAERHGYRAMSVPNSDPARAIKAMKHLEAFRTRQRNFPSDKEGYAHCNKLIDAAIHDLGRGLACDLFFQAEREFWQRRNTAAQVQKRRQDRLGLGWANHDHHTYRCSRDNFVLLVAMWEKLGFQIRERYHAGKEAGWGAQVMDHPETGITTFNDVDLSPDELFQDFAHEPVAPRHDLGTVGLWCALHGDSFLQAGMHHLECQFDFDALKVQLEAENVKTMKPFTTFSYLRQAFTEGERWKVEEARLAPLVAAGRVSKEQAETFRTIGAVGSHLENLERNEGFKGFNQKGVSEIIAATDPRKLNR